MTRRQMKSQNVEKKLEIFFTHTYTFTRHTKNSVDVSCYCAIIGFEFVPFFTFYYNYTRKFSLVYYLTPYDDDKDTILI